ncbi:MAG: SDR family oxidoreductase [Bacteroidetes bacterium]|nr:SDR family oxidoreductase [Bacteroidota bacterium]
MHTNKTVVITGTSKGIGQMLAGHFLTQGMTVYGCSRGEATITHAAYHHEQVDLRDEMQVMRWVRSIRKSSEGIDILICNAADTSANMLTAHTSAAKLNEILSINFGGTYLVCREVSKLMLLKKYGRIITFSSMSVSLHEEGTSAYTASKAAVVEFTKVLAKELAAHHITCNVIAPSVYYTDTVQETLGQEILDHALSRLTIQRALTDADICHTVDYLASPLSAQVTGQVIHLGLVS